MGFFDFVASIGNKLFNRTEDAADKIKDHIEEQNPGIKDLNVEFEEGVVKLSGISDTAEAAEKAVLMAGNVNGVTKVISEIKAPPPTEKVEFYVIESGDTLSGIAKKYYGNASMYPKIFEANREVIKDPNKIFVGQKIRIPQ